MPESVEHAFVPIVFQSFLCAFLPLMPEGVEHIVSPRHVRRISTAFLPLMPEGVEHADLQSAFTSVVARFFL